MLLGQTINDWKKYPGFRPLKGVTSVPLMRPDGSILSTAGYDAVTQLFVDLQVDVLSVPEAPTLEQAQEAARYIQDEILTDFEGMTEASKSVFLSVPLTFVGREMFTGTVPAVIIDGNNAGTGKTLAARSLGYVCLGEEIIANNAVTDEDEIRKTTLSVLLQGKGLVLFDNASQNTTWGEGQTWQSLLTTTRPGIRQLGANKSPITENRAVWVITGINIEVHGDSARRFVTCRFETDHPHPEEDRDPSAFRHPDLTGWIRQNRPELLKACLTIFKGVGCCWRTTSEHQFGWVRGLD